MKPVELIKERFGELTQIQEKAIPKIAEGMNVLILAPTGYGKTEAALLPVLDGIKSTQGIAALYITPLRSLNRDLLRRFHYWCDKLDVTRDVRHGDTTQAQRTKQRKNPPQIMLTTIESLQALLLAPIMRRHLKNVKYIIVDEIHDVLDNKRGAQLSLGLERLGGIAEFKRIGISATVANPVEAGKLLFGSRMYEVVEAGKKRKMDISVEYLADRDKRLNRIKELAEKNRSLLFVNTRSTAEEIGGWLKKEGAPVEVHHGSLSKDVRIAAEDGFKSGKIKSLICTSSLELGIDVGDAELVVQYNSPHQVFRLIQRVGRSGHSITGIPRGILFPIDYDDALESEVIISLLESGWMEKKTIEKGALDVIAHQVVGIVLENYGLHVDEVHDILAKSGAYGISSEQLKKVALQLHAEGILFFNDDGKLKPRRRAREYYFSYLSTIPKTKRFLLMDSSTNRRIASLDEDFVGNLGVGDEFMSKGQVWEVLDITDDEVLASPGSGIDITIPSWVGEEIPVETEVAQGVGVLRRMKKKGGAVIPDEKTIVIEVVNDLVFMHSCFGRRVNETFGKIFAYKISQLIGESVRAVVDPYRVMIKLPFPVSADRILEVFMNVRDVKKEVEDSLRNSTLIRFKFTHVARMFGLVSEDSIVNQRFIDALKYSVVYEETMRSVMFRYYDVPGVEGLLRKIRKGDVKVVLDKRKTPGFFANIGISRLSSREAVGIFEPREKMINALKEKTLSKTLELVCLNCGATRYVYLATATDDIPCPRCEEKALAIKYKTKKDRELSGALLRNYGKRALIAMSVYGIGPATAERILSKLHKDEESFYLDIINAQKTFVKTKKYWKA